MAKLGRVYFGDVFVPEICTIAVQLEGLPASVVEKLLPVRALHMTGIRHHHVVVKAVNAVECQITFVPQDKLSADVLIDEVDKLHETYRTALRFREVLEAAGC